jgi:putative intracellular protease/amidase
MSDSVKRKVFLYLYDTMADFEATLAAYYLNQQENFEIIPISMDTQPKTAISGIVYLPTLTVAEIGTIGEEIAGIIFPGGYDITCPPLLQNLIVNLHNKKKLVAAICAGPTYLALAGILNGKKFTTTRLFNYYEDYPDQVDPFPRDNFQDQRVVRDGNIITAVGHAFVDFALEIWNYFGLFENEAEREAAKLDFTPQ